MTMQPGNTSPKAQAASTFTSTTKAPSIDHWDANRGTIACLLFLFFVGVVANIVLIVMEY